MINYAGNEKIALEELVPLPARLRHCTAIFFDLVMLILYVTSSAKKDLIAEETVSS